MLAAVGAVGLAAAAAWLWAWLDARAKTGPVEVFAPSEEEEEGQAGGASKAATAEWARFHRAALARCRALQRPYAPSPFFTNPHAETILAAKLRGAPEIAYRREVLRASDGGAVALDWEHWDAPAETGQQAAAAADKQQPPQEQQPQPEPVRYGHDAAAAREDALASRLRNSPHDPLPDDAPLLVLFPGLTGGSGDAYVRHCVASARARGVRAVVFNSRGTADSPVLTPRFYSASFTQDAREVVAHVRRVYPRAQGVYAVGWSLGGNILLRYLAEEGEREDGEAAAEAAAAEAAGGGGGLGAASAAASPAGASCPPSGGLDAAVSLCNPFDLTLSNAHLKRGFFGRLYDANLAASLKRIFARHAAVFDEARAAGALPAGVLPERVPEVRTIADFDAWVTAPTFGWPSVARYYAASSSSLAVPRVRVPLLCVQAADDPIAPEHAIPRAALAANPRCALVVTRTGGHLGWVTAEEGVRGAPWTDGVVADWLAAVHEARSEARRRRRAEDEEGGAGAVGGAAEAAAAAATATTTATATARVAAAAAVK
jgi:predicted alpha/beta-fold hydrolase